MRAAVQAVDEPQTCITVVLPARPHREPMRRSLSVATVLLVVVGVTSCRRIVAGLVNADGRPDRSSRVRARGQSLRSVRTVRAWVYWHEGRSFHRSTSRPDGTRLSRSCAVAPPESSRRDVGHERRRQQPESTATRGWNTSPAWCAPARHSPSPDLRAAKYGSAIFRIRPDGSGRSVLPGRGVLSQRGCAVTGRPAARVHGLHGWQGQLRWELRGRSASHQHERALRRHPAEGQLARAGLKSSPAWSPDGLRLAWLADICCTKNAPIGIYAAALDGNALRRS